MTDTAFTWTSAAVSDVGKVRKLNEDSVLDRGAVGLWVVADGMGGHSAGDLASQLIVNSLSKLEPSDDLGEFVDRA
jgi:serine/threonine protein phosphatase PrpC